MASNHRTVLVTGATGKQGGSVVRHMLENGWNLRAFTRDPNNRAADALADKGVEMVRGDLEDPNSFEAALRGVYGVYSVQDFASVLSSAWNWRSPAVSLPTLRPLKSSAGFSAGQWNFKQLPIPTEKEFHQMFRWFNDSGFGANIPELRKRYPEVQLQTLEQWRHNEG